MKVAVMSDNHGDDEQIEQVLAYEKNADVFIHCGDSEAYGPILDRFYAVRGNNDWFNPNLKNEITLNLEGHRIVVTHGHRAGYYGREAYFLSLAEGICSGDRFYAVIRTFPVMRSLTGSISSIRARHVCRAEAAQPAIVCWS